MRANELLLWLSARRQGSWQQFRGAVEELHMEAEAPSAGDLDVVEDTTETGGLSLYQILRLNLARLAHVEFFAGGCEKGWRVTPPLLATHERGGSWTGVLCGARSGALLGRILEIASRTVLLDTLPLDGAPDLVQLSGDNKQHLAGIAEQTGVFLQHEAPLALLSVLPTVDDASCLSPKELPFGKDRHVERFLSAGLSWRESAREEAKEVRKGLFRFQLRHEREYYLCARGNAYSINGQAGKFVMLQGRRKVMHYRITDRELLLPAICRPPLLVERALVLCSGILPSYDPYSSTLVYRNIPVRVAQLAAQLLRQEVLIEQ